ncbi:hypothetical protein LJR267_010000 [Paraburkholderia hospita]|jgi:hypothetical protein|uniref:hypothetical protein n=1 Tax=Paraburkholderia hospita TaxID=169430 RepID=UPI003ECC72E6
MQRTDMVSKQLTAAFEREPHVKFQVENHRITLAGRVATKAERWGGTGRRVSGCIRGCRQSYPGAGLI